MDAPLTGAPIVIHGIETPNGLWGHPPSQLSYDLGGDYTEFTTRIATREQMTCGDGATFTIRLDGEVLYESPIVFPQDPPAEVTVDVTDGYRLDLITFEGRLGEWYCDWAVWIEPAVR